MTLEGSGHVPHARDPVKVNLLLRDFVEPAAEPRRRVWTRGRRRRKRALYISSPIGLGHAQRDVAIARELRKLRPGPRDRLARAAPGDAACSRARASASTRRARTWRTSRATSSRESAEHDLHCFQAWRRMDEILVANFMVFHDLVREEHYDLWIGDEAWELDYYLHENPEQKRAAYVWLTDFVGWLPMADGGEREAFLTADYNAEMIEHIARYPRVRDRALFVGNPDDIVPEPLRARPAADPRLDRGALRLRRLRHAASTRRSSPTASRCARELGYAPDEQRLHRHRRRLGRRRPPAAAGDRRLPGGEAAGARAAHDRRGRAAHRPARRCRAATGSRCGAYVHNLYRHLAACDLAVVQGGLTTSMELTANRRPFLYFPLRHHFEQNFHVRHRLERYGAGRRMDFDESTPEVIAEAIAEEIGREVDYRPVETDGAPRGRGADRRAALDVPHGI